MGIKLNPEKLTLAKEILKGAEYLVEPNYITSGATIEAANGNARIIASGVNSWVRVNLVIEEAGEENEKFNLKIKNLLAALEALSKEGGMLTPGERRLTVKTPGKKLTFPLEKSEPPAPPQGERKLLLEKSSSYIKSILVPHRLSGGKDFNAPLYAKAVFLTGGENPRIFSTDGKILLIKNLKEEVPEEKILFPKSIIRALNSLPDSGQVSIFATERSFVVQGEAGEIEYEIGTSQVEDSVPNIDSILEKEGEKIGEGWETEKLLETVKEALKLLGKNSDWVNLREEDGALKITVRSDEKFFETDINAAVEEGTNFFLAPELLMAGLQYLKENGQERFHIKAVGEGAVSFTGEEDENTKVLIALMRITD